MRRLSDMGMGGRAKEQAPVMFSCKISLRVRVVLVTVLLISITALTILCSQLVVWQSWSSAPLDWRTTPFFATWDRSQNETIFRDFAAIDPSERLMREQIQDLLKREIPNPSNRPLFVSIKDPQFNYRVQVAKISTPRYIPFWPEFKRLLREWAQIKSYDPQVMHSLVSQIKDPVVRHYEEVTEKPRLNQAEQSKYRSCAVVGNSGILLQQSYGSAIDAHDMVMRLNNARTTNFEKFVGSKTTISFVNSNILHGCSMRADCFCHPYGANVPIVLYICQVIHMMDIAVCRNAHKAPLMVTDPRFDNLVARIVKWYSVKEFMQKTGESFARWNMVHDGENFHYSSGMQAVMLALGICEEVNLFGFGKDNTSQHHYHTRQRQELGLHDYEAEYRIYEDLSQQQQQQKKQSKLLPFLDEFGFDLPPLHVFR